MCTQSTNTHKCMLGYVHVCTCIIYKVILDILNKTIHETDMTTGTRKRSCSRLVFSAVHKNRPCMPCVLCNEAHSVYTHPGKWKDENVLHFLESIEPDSHIGPDSCICRNCQDCLTSGRRIQKTFHLGGRKQNMTVYVMYLVVQNQHLEV